MTTYGFDFIGPDGRIHSVDLGEFASDEDAADHARKILSASLTTVAVDVWCDKRRILHLDRAAPDAPGAPRPDGGRPALEA